MNKIRLGVVGLGSRGKGMFSLAAEAFDQAVPAALCDLKEELWKEKQGKETLSFADKFPEAVFYTDYDRMLAETPIDAVLVETPAAIHAEFCIKALERGIAVLSDVPFAATIEEGNRLWECVKKTGTLFMAGANPNEWGFVEALVDLYEKGFLGELSLLEAEYIHDVRSLWKTTPWRSSGAFWPITYCTHSLGPLLRILKEDLRYVSCLGTGSKICPDDPTRQDMMTAHFHTESNVVVRLMTSFINNAHIGLHSYRIFGTAGYFERFSGRGKLQPATFFSSEKIYGAQELTELPIQLQRKEISLSADGGHGGADQALLQRFFLALQKKAEPIDIREGLRMTFPGIYACESARQGGRMIEIRYPWD
ncbi:MAG: Gfo/Idh/MocA family oxidoreductase [Lentisphaeria bacterium]